MKIVVVDCGMLYLVLSFSLAVFFTYMYSMCFIFLIAWFDNDISCDHVQIFEVSCDW